MDYDKKLAFIHKMAKLGLEHAPQHLAPGGAVQGNAIAPIPQSPTAPGPNQGGGTNGGSNGVNTNSNLFDVANNFTAGSANVTSGTSQAQLGNAYTGAQNGINAQTNLTNATMPGTTQGLNAQSVLSNQLANEANGVGPNPAQAALNQTTGQNIAQQAALAASTRGASTNAGLIATQNAQTGAATQQQAVGQAATLQAQQEIAAQQEQAGLAATQVGQGQTAATTLSQEQQNEQNILQNANSAYNNAAVSMQGNINNTNAQTAAANANANSGLLSQIGNTISSIFAHGGLVRMDKGGNVLDAHARKHIAAHNFALPGRRYPIHDENHARNALARVSQNGSPAEKKQVRAAVHKKYPDMGKRKMMADGGDPSDGPPFMPTTGSVVPPISIPAATAAPANTGGFLGLGLTSGPLLAKGGKVEPKMMADGGYMAPTPLVVSSASGPQSSAGKWINSPTSSIAAPSIAANQSAPSAGGGAGGAATIVKEGRDLYNNYNSGHTGAAYQTQDEADEAQLDADVALGNEGENGESLTTAGGAADAADAGADAGAADAGADAAFAASRGGLAAKGGGVAAKNSKQKAKVAGDSFKNDKVPAMLSEGEVVMDRDTLADPGPVGQMARAVAKHIEARNKKQRGMH